MPDAEKVDARGRLAWTTPLRHGTKGVGGSAGLVEAMQGLV